MPQVLILIILRNDISSETTLKFIYFKFNSVTKIIIIIHHLGS